MAAKCQKQVWARIMESDEYSDLKFTCNGEEFKVHKIVVCGHSPVIKAALKEGFKEAETNVIVMDEFQPSTVKRMIQFMYTGNYWGEGDEDESSTDEEASSEREKEKYKVNEEESNEANSEEDESEPTDDEGDKASIKSANPPPSKSDVATGLFEHVHVNSIGDYYKIDGLVSLANTKIKNFLRSNWKDKSWVSELPTVIETVAGSTGDDELLEIVSSATATNISSLLEVEAFKNLSLISDFAFQVLQNCDREQKALRKEVNEFSSEKKRFKEVSKDLQSLNKSVKTLNRRKECMNCSTEFPCFIDTYETILRCSKCRCRHKY